MRGRVALTVANVRDFVKENIRVVFGSVLSVIAIAIIAYVFFQLKNVQQLRSDYAKIQAEYINLTNEFNLYKETSIARIKELEELVLVDIEPQVLENEKKLKSIPAAFRATPVNLRRIDGLIFDLRTRVNQLEHWRLLQESK